MKAVVRANQNNAGLYGTVNRIGRLAVGQSILVHVATEEPAEPMTCFWRSELMPRIATAMELPAAASVNIRRRKQRP